MAENKKPVWYAEVQFYDDGSHRQVNGSSFEPWLEAEREKARQEERASDIAEAIVAAYENGRRFGVAEERERIAAEIEKGYLGPDFARRPDGTEGPEAHAAAAYDEGLEYAARVARIREGR